MNGVDAMPVCIKPEPQESNAHSATPSAVSHEHGAPMAGETLMTPSSSAAVVLGGTPNYTPVQASLTNSAAPASNKPKEKTQAPLEDAIDYDSVRGVFGWTTLDGINVPYIIRKYRKFVAVRIVEKKMLSKYPNSFPDELGKKEPLVSYFVTEAEANLLNEINTVHCSFEYGHQPFTTKDLIVDLVEFEDFYNLVKKTFPEDVLASMANEGDDVGVDEKKKQLSKLCGWMQINNTVTPYINRAAGKYVPLSVIVYAAGLLRKENVEGLLPTPEECNLLNATCQTAGFDFSFGKNTRLIHIAEVVQRCQVRIFELPFENPLQHAQYIDSLQQNDPGGGSGVLVPHPPPPPYPRQAGIAGSMSLPYRSKPHSAGPPNVNIFGSQYNPFVSMMNMMSQPSSSTNSMSGDAARFPPAISQASQTHSVPQFFPPNPLMQMNAFNPSVFNHLAGLRPDLDTVTSQGHKAPSSGSPGMQSQPGMQPGQVPPYPGVLPRGPHPHMLPPFGHFPPHPMPHGGRPLMHPPPGMMPHRFPNHMGDHQPGMMFPGLGPIPRGAVPMVGFPPPPGFPPGPAGSMPPPSAPPHPHQLQQHLSARSSPRSIGMSPVGERVSPARHSPHGPVHTSITPPIHMNVAAHSRDAGPPVHMNSVNQSGEPVHLNQVREPVVPVQMSAVGRGIDPAVEVSSMNTSAPVEVSPTSHNRDSAIMLAGRAKTPPPPPQQDRPKTVTLSDGHLRLVADIIAVLIHNKSISCLVRDTPERKGKFCLVEAVSKLYFPHCKLGEFVHALQHVLKIDLPLCTEEEAKAFIHFYNLPVSTLNDNHMIRMEDLQTYFPQMAYMFGPCDGAKPKPQPVTTRRSSGPDSTRLTSPSAPITVVLSSNDNDEIISIDSDPPTPVLGSPGQGQGSGTKRPAPPGSGTSATKQPCHRLEQMVQKLKQTQDPTGVSGERDTTHRAAGVSTTSSVTQSHASTAPVIVID